MTPLNVSHLACRMLLAFSFLVFALDGISLSDQARQHGTAGLHDIEWFAVITLSGLLMFVFIWLLFGLRTRVVSALGIVLFAGQFFWFRSLGLHTSYGVGHLAVSGILSLPLLFLGGGPFAIYRRGWQLPV